MTSRAVVLLLEDSDIDAELIGIHLDRVALPIEVVRTPRRRDFEAALQRGDVELVLADYSLPDFDGLAALRLVRETLPAVPFIFVSGVVGEDLATEALRQGATDYVLKRSLGRLPQAVERAIAEKRERVDRLRAEAALGASEANTRLAVAAAQLGMWQYSPGSRRFEIDVRCQRMFSLKDTPTLDHGHLLACVHPDDRPALERALADATATRSAGQLIHELRSVAPDGSERWIAMRGQAMFDREGRCTQLLGIVQDNTEQRAAEQRRLETELLFRLAAEAASMGVWALDLEGDSLWFDDGLRRIADLPEGLMLEYRELMERVVHPDDRPAVEATMAAAMQPSAHTPLDFELRMIGLRDRRTRWVAIKGRRVASPDGRQRLVGTMRDVTEQRRQQQALKHLNEILNQRVEQRTRERDRIWALGGDLMMIYRVDGRISATNPAFERLLGWSSSEMLEAQLVDFVHPDDAETTRAHLQRADSGTRLDGRWRHRDGSYRWVRWTTTLEEGLRYAVGRDISDERAAAEALAASNRELTAQIEHRGRVEATLAQMQRLEAVGQLTSGVAHDFNNLLTVVLSNIQLIRRLLAQAKLQDARIGQRLDSMQSASERGAKLIAQMLAFSRRQRLEPQVIDLNDAIDALRDLLHTTLGGSVEIKFELTKPLWPALVDVTQIELILLNLAINARDAMEVGGTLTIRTDNRELGAPRGPDEPEAGDYVELTVRDTGTGMTPEVLAKAFEPFFTTKEIGKGSGLGLAQIYGFAKQSGGGVRIETELGVGTAVHVLLPRARDAEAPAVVETASGLLDEAEPSDRTILLVDDDDAVREATAELIRLMGYRVLEAASGAQAIERLDGPEDVDLVVADFAMPGMNGAELARRLESLRPRLPLVFLTGFADLKALSGVPPDRVLQKPLSGEMLSGRIKRLLQQHG